MSRACLIVGLLEAVGLSFAGVGRYPTHGLKELQAWSWTWPLPAVRQGRALFWKGDWLWHSGRVNIKPWTLWIEVCRFWFCFFSCLQGPSGGGALDKLLTIPKLRYCMMWLEIVETWVICLRCSIPESFEKLGWRAVCSLLEVTLKIICQGTYGALTSYGWMFWQCEVSTRCNSLLR